MLLSAFGALGGFLYGCDSPSENPLLNVPSPALHTVVCVPMFVSSLAQP